MPASDRYASVREAWHGTTGGYTNHKCRCDDCRRAWREDKAGYRDRNPQRDRASGRVKEDVEWVERHSQAVEYAAENQSGSPVEGQQHFDDLIDAFEAGWEAARG